LADYEFPKKCIFTTKNLTTFGDCINLFIFRCWLYLYYNNNINYTYNNKLLNDKNLNPVWKILKCSELLSWVTCREDGPSTGTMYLECLSKTPCCLSFIIEAIICIQKKKYINLFNTCFYRFGYGKFSSIACKGKGVYPSQFKQMDVFKTINYCCKRKPLW